MPLESILKAKCPNCQWTMMVDAGEDGHPDIPASLCFHPGCEVWLCVAGCEHLSFVCDGCGHRHCNSHLHLVPDGRDRPLKLCEACNAEAGGFLKPIPGLKPITIQVMRPNVPEWGEVA